MTFFPFLWSKEWIKFPIKNKKVYIVFLHFRNFRTLKIVTYGILPWYILFKEINILQIERTWILNLWHIMAHFIFFKTIGGIFHMVNWKRYLFIIERYNKLHLYKKYIILFFYLLQRREWQQFVRVFFLSKTFKYLKENIFIA